MEARAIEPCVINHGRYRSGEELGRGSQGVVLRVVDLEAPGRALVAKLFHRAEVDDSAWQAEFRLLARLLLPGVVRAHDLCRDEVSGRPFLVEDFVPGVSVDVEVQRAPEAARSECLGRILAKTAQALSMLHAAGFVHGDLKPAHVKITPKGGVVLLDLGSAAAQASAAPPSGTRGFVAPERVPGSRASVASDLYALGALAFYAASGSVPQPGLRGIRAQLPWLGARVAELVESLLAVEPSARPRDTREVLAKIGRALPAVRQSHSLGTVGRERELETLCAAENLGVRYVSGPSGIGKSQLLREVWVTALLAGRPARWLSFPDADETAVARVIEFLKGEPAHASANEREAGGVLLLDGIDEGPRELRDALEAYRCHEREPTIAVIAACRAAPPHAVTVQLSALTDANIRELARSLASGSELDIEHAVRFSQGNPGWLCASLGGLPFTQSHALERVRALSPEASRLVFAVARCNAELAESALRSFLGWRSGAPPLALTEAFEAGLLVRRVGARGTSYVLPVPALAAELAQALAEANPGAAEQLARVLLDCPEVGAQQLICATEGLVHSPLSDALLERAVELARSRGMPSVETAALLALVSRAEHRDTKRLLRLERLTRDSGRQAEYPAILEWLERAAESDPGLVPLVLRRSAERSARRGQHGEARELIARALAAASASGSKAAEGLVHASAGALLLYRADWRSAEAELALAERLLGESDEADPEELARLGHNAGVVALYAGRVEQAAQRFQESIAKKRQLGDLAGVRACLLNLGLAATKVGKYAEAEAALDEAIALARSLSQPAGEAWTLSARTELEIERGQPEQAERWLAEANELIGVAPAVVRTDLRLLAARIALLRSDARAALASVDALEPELADGDASQKGRALLIRAEAALLELPARPRRAARLAAQALRLARTAELQDLEKSARSLLGRARPSAAAPRPGYPDAVNQDGEGAEWRWLQELLRGNGCEAALLALCRLAIERTGAERALIARLDAQGNLLQAWGVDLDGYPLANAEARFSRDLLPRLLAQEAWFYQRDLQAGSRVAARVGVPPGQHLAVVLEHRFRNAHFDNLDAKDLERWALLGGLALRVEQGGNDHSAPRSSQQGDDGDELATRLPLRSARRPFPGIVGSSTALERALQRLDAAVDSLHPALIRGETGTGKELFARALHEQGPRRARAFVAVNCAAIADSLFEAEVFGHTRGAFTGAERARPGLLAEAEGGTLLLDEIGELSLARQATLLRLLESGRYRPVGADREQTSTARIVAATNKNLEQAVESGHFRRDLLFRINVLEIQIPPLRERSADIPALVADFFAKSGAEATISDAALEQLRAYDWPGNVRELAHLIDRLLALGARRIDVEDLPRALRRRLQPSVERTSSERPSETLSERDQVALALSHCNGNITHAARALGLSRHGLKKRMLRLGLRGGDKK